jgi:hypothetical protein
MTEQKKNEQTPEATDLERRAFVAKTAALAGAVGVAGADPRGSPRLPL